MRSRPRPGFLFHELRVLRITEHGATLERLYPSNALVPRAFDIDARNGRLDLASSTGGVAVQSASVRAPRPRMRVLRH